MSDWARYSCRSQGYRKSGLKLVYIDLDPLQLYAETAWRNPDLLKSTVQRDFFMSCKRWITPTSSKIMQALVYPGTPVSFYLFGYFFISLICYMHTFVCVYMCTLVRKQDSDSSRWSTKNKNLYCLTVNVVQDILILVLMN